MTNLPSPLVPADVDLRGFEFMPLFGDRLFKSETWISASADAKVAALRLWWHSYGHEVPAGSLPDNDGLLAEYAGYGVMVKAWKKLKPQAMRGYVLCSDGRWYHPLVSELAIDGWKERVRNREKQRAWRERNQNKDRNVTVTKTVTQPGTEPLCHAGEGEGQGQREVKTSGTDVPGGKPPAMKPEEIIFGYGLPLLTNAGTAEKQARSFLGGLRKAHGDAAVIDKLRECLRAKPLQPLEWLAKALPPAGAQGHSKQTQLESRNAAVVAGWVPPELREKEAAA